MKILMLLLLSASALGAQTFDTTFKVSAAAQLTAATFDVVTSINRTKCHELDLIYGRNPSPAHFTSELYTINFVNLFVAYELKKHHKRIWAALPMTLGSLHVVGATQNLHSCY